MSEKTISKKAYDIIKQSFTKAMYGFEGVADVDMNSKLIVFAAKAGLIKDIFGNKL